MNLEIERLEMHISHQAPSSQSPARINSIDPDREHNQRLFYSMGRLIYSLNRNNGYSQPVMETKENIMSFHHIEAFKFLIQDASTIRVNSTGQNTTFELDFLACNPQLLANANCMLNATQSLGPTAVDYSKQGAEVYLTVDSSVYKTNLGSLPPQEKFALNDDISEITFDKEFTKLYVITHSSETETHTVRYFNLLTDESSKPILLNGNPDQITHAVFVGDQAIICQTRADRNPLLLLDPYSGKYSYVSEEITTLPCNHSECSGVLAITALAYHSNKDQSLFAVDGGSTLISLSYNGNQNNRQESNCNVMMLFDITLYLGLCYYRSDACQDKIVF